MIISEYYHFKCGFYSGDCYVFYNGDCRVGLEPGVYICLRLLHDVSDDIFGRDNWTEYLLLANYDPIVNSGTVDIYTKQS